MGCGYFLFLAALTRGIRTNDSGVKRGLDVQRNENCLFSNDQIGRPTYVEIEG